MQEKARPFISDNAVIKTEELEKTLKEMQAEGRDLKVGIIGRVKAGKSSLLNALIFEGVEVLPKAATPMTASLTVLKYANTLNAEVEFYSPKDIAELKNEHERYVREFNRIVDEEVKKQKEKQSLSNRAKEGIKSFGNKFSGNKSDKEAPKERVLSDEEIVKKAERIAKSELEKDTKLVSSYDQYEKMKKSGLLNTENLDPRIQANSLQELNQKLLQFVGADGKYMPYTKAVQISLNNPNLKDLEVIDTPGVNDPIASREERTKALLKDCHVVFIISPSNQFLTDSDMDLFDRVSHKEGLQEIYFVASQADSAVGSMSEVEKSNQHLPTAFENAQKALSSQLKGYADDNNYRLQLDYSLKNLIELKRFKEAMNESYQSDLNDEKLQNDLREWRDLKNTPEEENYREFEEIKKMALYFRDYYMFCLDWYDLSQEKIQEYRDLIDRRNEMLQLDYSLRNLSILKGYKERNEKAYQDYLNDEELQNDLRKWKNGDKPGFFESLFNDLFGK
ncbi:dynamin family protein [Helicobacter pylori]